MEDDVRVFISWSGAKSRAVAKALRDWLPKILNNAKPWMSELDIESGQDWNQRITGELASATIGIVCVTPENQDRPWLNYEAGAISKQVNGEENRVIPFLIDFAAPTDLTGPLTKFQVRLATEIDIRRMVLDINSQLVAPLREPDLEETFTYLWPPLKKQLDQINREYSGRTAERRDEREMIEEILTLVRSLHPSQRPPAGAGLVSASRDVFAVVSSALERAGFDGHFASGWDGQRVTVTSDRAVPQSAVSEIGAGLRAIDPGGSAVFDVDPDRLEAMESEADDYRSSRIDRFDE